MGSAEPKRMTEGVWGSAEPKRMTEGVLGSAEPKRVTEGVLGSAEPKGMTEGVLGSAEPKRMTESRKDRQRRCGVDQKLGWQSLLTLENGQAGPDRVGLNALFGRAASCCISHWQEGL